MFKWAVSEELAPASVYQALCTVAGLKYGRTTARETQPVTPVDDHWVDATLPYLAPHVADMFRVQRLTGMRPGDVTLIRWQDIDRSGDIWVYRPVGTKCDTSAGKGSSRWGHRLRRFSSSTWSAHHTRISSRRRRPVEGRSVRS